MKVLLGHVLLVFGAQQEQQGKSSGSAVRLLDKFSFLSMPSLQPSKNMKKTSVDQLRNEKLLDLLQAAKEVGQVGSLATPEQRQRIQDLVDSLLPLSEYKKSPAQFPLVGEHKLVYSAAPGASSGRIFGNVIGQVTQLFQDDETFYNRVALGPFSIALKAKRKIMNDSTIKVSFLETKFSLLDKITLKEGKVGGGGTWKVKFVGTVNDSAAAATAGGSKKLIRIMETPSLFILEQPILE
jgi:hypothetical protein